VDPSLKNELEYEIICLYEERGSVCFFIQGRRGTGKTDWALLKAEILNKFGIITQFASNVKITDSYFPIAYITNLQDLDFWAQSTNRRKLFILDEAGKTLRRRTPMSKINIELLDDLQTLRKFHLSLDLIAPAEKYIDSASLGSDVLDVVFFKPNFKDPKVGIWVDQQEPYRATFTGIPRTSIKFDTFDVATFTRTGPKKIPIFKDADKELLWKWSHGDNSKTLGVDSMKIHRLTMKFIKEVMEREANP
jgi:hypothetical protein